MERPPELNPAQKPLMLRELEAAILRQNINQLSLVQSPPLGQIPLVNVPSPVMQSVPLVAPPSVPLYRRQPTKEEAYLANFPPPLFMQSQQLGNPSQANDFHLNGREQVKNKEFFQGV